MIRYFKEVAFLKQTKFKRAGSVLIPNGSPVAGYSTKEILRYDRRAIKAPPWRIKEWDFYQVSDGEKCLQFTLGHASYIGQVGVMLFNFKTGEKIASISKLIPLPFGSMHLPPSAQSDNTVTCTRGGMEMKFETKGNERTLFCRCAGFEANIRLVRKNDKAIVINIPFDQSPKQFYYNHKINCMTAQGSARMGDKEYIFSPDDSFGLLDWGRGVWPFHNEWYWSNGTGIVGDEIFGFNLGCGFGNTSTATENILFYKNSAHKLGKVSITHEADFMKPWRLTDDEGRLDFTLTPLYDRTTKDKVLFIDNCCHQVFGFFNGTAVLNDGSKLDIKNLTAFAEHAVNNW
jgi:hypothetical protein